MTATREFSPPISEHSTPRKSTSKRRKGWGGRIGVAVLLIIVIYPMLWIFLGSFKQQNEFLSEPFWALPQVWDVSNYVDAFVDGGIGTYMKNSVLAVFPSLALIIIFGTAAAFALEVMIWKGRSAVLILSLIHI